MSYGYSPKVYGVLKEKAMKKLIPLGCFVLMLGLAACDKNEDEDPQMGDCPVGKMCFELNGSDIQVDAVWYEINDQRTRIYYENGSGTAYENIELDFYGSSQGDFSFVPSSAVSGEATFEYFKADGSGGVRAESGMLTLTKSGDTISGEFTLSGKDPNGTTVSLQTGVINQVPIK